MYMSPPSFAASSPAQAKRSKGGKGGKSTGAAGAVGAVGQLDALPPWRMQAGSTQDRGFERLLDECGSDGESDEAEDEAARYQRLRREMEARIAGF
jgi:hypothetical protein